MTDLDSEKRALRRRMRLARDAVANREVAEAAILSAARAHIPDGAVVAGYHGVGSEVDALPLLAELHRAGHCAALPVARADAALAFRRWRPGARLVAGAFRVPEPVDGEPIVPDVLLVPLLAFDAAGYRCGQGGGHYDRTLAALPQARTIGLAFEAQRVDTVPRDRLDKRLDLVVTERAAYGPGFARAPVAG